MSEHPLSQQTVQEQLNGHFLDMDLASRIEALLFVANEPASIDHLAQALEVSEGEVERALEELADQCSNRGLRLQRNDRRVQFVTAPRAAEDVRRFLGLDNSSKLSTAALETLALVAYRQPITRAEMESIRGVNCDSVLRTLLSHGLVASLGRLDRVGRPIIYGTTFEFLQYFGLSDLCELPAWADVAVSRGGQLDEPGREADKVEQL